MPVPSSTIPLEGDEASSFGLPDASPDAAGHSQVLFALSDKLRGVKRGKYATFKNQTV